MWFLWFFPHATWMMDLLCKSMNQMIMIRLMDLWEYLLMMIITMNPGFVILV